ncbi:MAG TPA: DUF948 domain-containing protein [Geobacteraceae bacterium]|nr:DUF948 domain-containing protein [Geobacteraceae bacterium]
MIMDLAVLLIAIAIVILAAFIIPVFIELKKSSIALREFIGDLDRELKPALHELQGTLKEAKGLLAEVSARTEEIKTLTTALGETGHNLRVINHALGSAVGVVTSTSAWAAGVRAAFKLIVERLAKKRKEEG